MSRIKAIIADDEAPLRNHLQSMLNSLWPELDIVGMAANGNEALTLIHSEAPDIAFLDIKMPVLTGIQVALSSADSCHIVFVTAYDDYAVEAFESAAIDYLLKPIEELRLAKTIKRLQARLNEKKISSQEWVSQLEKIIEGSKNPNLQGTLRWIRASKQDDTLLIPVDDVYYFKAEDKYTTVVTKDNQYLIRKSIKELGLALDTDAFWQIHRGIIVNMNYVARTSKSKHGRLLLHFKNIKETIMVSRSYTYRFKQM